LAVVVGILFAYYQYLDQSIQTAIGREETLFSATATQLDSESEAVRASAVDTLYNLAFTRTPIEAPPGPIAPYINVSKWLLYRPEYRNFERCTDLFAEFAAAPRRPVSGDRDMVSGVLITTAVLWMEQQRSLLQIERRSPARPLLDRAQLKKAYAPSADLHDVQFHDADLSYSVLSSSNLSGANLPSARLIETDLSMAHLENANLSKTNLKGAHLNFAHLENAHLDRADLRGADLTLATAIKANLSGANLSGAILHSATLRAANLEHANLAGISFAATDLSGADLAGSDLHAADFRAAIGLAQVKSWRGAILRGTLFPSGFQPLLQKEPHR
jgi:uncharacterized protein YjbI with pentapeptide repeats